MQWYLCEPQCSGTSVSPNAVVPLGAPMQWYLWEPQCSGTSGSPNAVVPLGPNGTASPYATALYKAFLTYQFKLQYYISPNRL